MTCATCRHCQPENGAIRCFWALTPTTLLPEWLWLQVPLIDPTGGTDCRAYLPNTQPENETHD